MDFDKILQYVGEFGKYQKLLYFSLCFPPILVSMNMLAYVFNSAVPLHRCYIPGCDNASSTFCEPWLNYSTPTLPHFNPNDTCGKRYDPCKRYTAINESSTTCSVDFNYTDIESCSEKKFDTSVYGLTVVAEWDLTCDSGWLGPFSGSIWMAGVIVGAAVFGALSDRIGRRRTLMAAFAVMSVTSFAVPFCPNYVVFLIVRFVQATSSSGVYQTIFVLVTELVGQSWRMYCGIGITIAFAIGEVLLGATAYFLRDWKHLQFALAAPTLLFLPYFWIVPESVRWLISQKQYREAQIVIQKMAKVNQSSVPIELLELDFEILTTEQSADNKYEVKKKSALDLFRRPRMRRRTFNILLNWFMNTIGYYGISMNVSNLGGDVYVDFILVSLVELPSYVFCLLVLDRWGRRRPLILCMVFGGLACLSTKLVPPEDAYQSITVGLAILGKFGTAASFAIIYIYSAELFPTVLRNNGIGLSSFVAHVGGVLVPYIAGLNDVYKGLPLLIYGASLFLSGVLAIFLPETHGQRLPETVEDAEAFGSKSMDRNVSTVDTDEGEALLWDQGLVQRNTVGT